MIVKYDRKGYADQSALTDKQQTITDDSIEAIYGDILLNFKKFLVGEEENAIIVDDTLNFIYAFSNTISEGHGSNRGKDVITISSGVTSRVFDTNQFKWLSCVILAGMVCFFLTLLAVGASQLRYFLPLLKSNICW